MTKQKFDLKLLPVLLPLRNVFCRISEEETVTATRHSDSNRDIISNPVDYVLQCLLYNILKEMCVCLVKTVTTISTYFIVEFDIISFMTFTIILI